MAVYIISIDSADGERYKVGHTIRTTTQLLADYTRYHPNRKIRLFITTSHYKEIERSVLTELTNLRVPHDSGRLSEWVMWSYSKLSRLVMRTVDEFESSTKTSGCQLPEITDLKSVCKFLNIPMTDARQPVEYYRRLLDGYRLKNIPPVNETPRPKDQDSDINLSNPSETTKYLTSVLNELKKINPSFKLFYSSKRCLVGMDCGGKLFTGVNKITDDYQEFTSTTDPYLTESTLKKYIKNQLQQLL